MHMMSVWIEFGVTDHRRDRVERFFSRSVRVVCLQSSVALDQRRRLEVEIKGRRERSESSYCESRCDPLLAKRLRHLI